MAPADSFALKGTSIRIPARGLGTFQADPKIYPEGSVKKSVIHAIQAGYRHLDVALGYEWGAVEREVGQAIKECGIPREELFVVSKLCESPPFQQRVQFGNHSAALQRGKTASWS